MNNGRAPTGGLPRSVPDGVESVEVDARRTSDDRLLVAHHPADDEDDAYGTDPPAAGALWRRRVLAVSASIL